MAGGAWVGFHPMDHAITRLAALQERFIAHLFEGAVAIGWAIIGIAYLTNAHLEDHSPIGREVQPFDLVWSILYLVACPMILYGLWWGSRHWRWRVAGLILLTTGLIMQGIAAATFELEPRVAVYAVYAAACFLRAALLTQIIRPARR